MNACNAAIEIDRHMSRVSDKAYLPTRIGVHAGDIMLGNLGAIDHFEYRPVGDIVNATTRLDGLNKRLGTRILVSEDVARHIEGFLFRNVGRFLLVGKIKPLRVFELICRKDEADTSSIEACTAFERSLALFEKGDWDAAAEMFRAYCSRFPDDGPARFYLDKCGHYISVPPEGEWDGVIKMDVK
jgi:adenylate cyclase